MIRPAEPHDRAAIEAIVASAYGVYVEQIGKPPGPMFDDYARLIAQNRVNVFEDADGTVAALIVLLPQTDHLLLDNVAVRPDRQGQGLGRQLLAFAESEARRLAYSEVRLYTHVTMSANIALYRRRGYTEAGRGHDAGYDRVFMRLPLV